MSNSAELSPPRLPWPPILYIAAVACSILLGQFVPLPWLGPPLSDILFAIGWLLAAAAVAMDVAAIRAFRRAKTSLNPMRPADHLVTDGPYSFSRNPLYLGNTALMVAIGLIVGNLWFLLFGVVAALATQKLAIEPEERLLALRFGKRYREYQKKVRRWF